MRSDPLAARRVLRNAERAMQSGDNRAARRWAEMAAALAPDIEDPWLLLAAIANPRASVAYLEQALKINPRSEQARQGMHWAAERLRRERTRQPPPDETQPHRPGTVRTPSRRPRPAGVARSIPPSEPLPDNSLTKYRWSFVTLLLMVVCVAAAWALWPVGAAPALEFLRAPQNALLEVGAAIGVDKPTYTPTFTPTFTPSNTPSPTPTPTDTPTSTWTPLPTDTPLPSNTPRPWPTSTPLYSGGGGGVRWIDVNLSQQMVYAYEGNTIVASFLVSTGVAQFPTVTGQYRIYIKLVSTDMSGPGYYLPNVPYTMYFYRGYGFHGTYWHSNFGTPMSHGCVNMYTPDAEWLFYWASVGTLVNIHY